MAVKEKRKKFAQKLNPTKAGTVNTRDFDHKPSIKPRQTPYELPAGTISGYFSKTCLFLGVSRLKHMLMKIEITTPGR